MLDSFVEILRTRSVSLDRMRGMEGRTEALSFLERQKIPKPVKLWYLFMHIYNFSIIWKYEYIWKLTILTALSKSQSLNTISGDFPPNSRDTFFKFALAQLKYRRKENTNVSHQSYIQFKYSTSKFSLDEFSVYPGSGLYSLDKF